jgi:hypothetical protein
MTLTWSPEAIDCVTHDEQALRDQIDDEIVNHELMECLDAGSRPHREGRLTGRRATFCGSRESAAIIIQNA